MGVLKTSFLSEHVTVDTCEVVHSAPQLRIGRFATAHGGRVIVVGTTVLWISSSSVRRTEWFFFTLTHFGVGWKVRACSSWPGLWITSQCRVKCSQPFRQKVTLISWWVFSISSYLLFSVLTYVNYLKALLKIIIIIPLQSPSRPLKYIVV